MEKYMRLLNPKTINYEADRIDGGTPSITAQDIILAMSYAQLTPLQDNLIRLKYLGANTQANVKIFSKLLVVKYQTLFSGVGLSLDYQEAVTLVALTEFCLVPANYVPSERKRGVICGWSSTVVHNHLKMQIDIVLKDLTNELEIGENKIFTQVSKIK